MFRFHYFFIVSIDNIALPIHLLFLGCQKVIHEQLTWEGKSELKAEVLHDLKEIGSALYWMSLLDIVLVC